MAVNLTHILKVKHVNAFQFSVGELLLHNGIPIPSGSSFVIPSFIYNAGNPCSLPLTISNGSTANVYIGGDCILYRIDSGSGYYENGIVNTTTGINCAAGDVISLSTAGSYVITALLETAISSSSAIVYSYSSSIIDEPIGWDNFSVRLQRHDYHGIGAEVSMDMLEFYGAAFGIIKNAYDADIDSEVVYTIKDENNVTIYTGRVDLSTCSFLNGDYQSVKVKVGEIGDMTTFNNRVDKEVDIDDPKTIDGATVDVPDWMSLHIPMKHLLYTNFGKPLADRTITTSGGYNPYPQTGIYIGTSAPYLFIPMGDDINAEFGSLVEKSWGEYPSYDTGDLSNVDPQYIADEEHETKYGQDTIAVLEIKLKATIERKDGGWSPYAQGGYIRWHLEAVDGEDHVLIGEEQKVLQSEVNYNGATWDLSCDLNGGLMAGGSIKYYLVFDIDMPSGGTSRYFFSHITVQKGTYVKMTMYDNLAEDDVKTKMLLVHDALNVVSHAISENALAVKSQWYSTPESNWEPTTGGSVGRYSLKALTNGYKIRGLFTDDENKRNMPLSFKSLIESLSALDCIGWGFSNENGSVCVRVERWTWFYKDTVVLTLTNVAEVTTEVYTDRIPTEFKIGYKKYATQDQYNSIESPHGTRTYNNAIKALSMALTKECEFIADNYAIEETRRARMQKNETEETTYDENIFVFELTRASGVVATYKIDHTAVNAENVGRESEFINAKLTPRHMAMLWLDYIFATNNNTPFRFTTGEINYKAKFGVVPETRTVSGRTIYSLYPGETDPTTPRMENANLPYTSAIFKAEKITFSYPLTISQYQAVKANPYGLISVNGVLGWLLDFKYSFADGMADFVLIAKNS